MTDERPLPPFRLVADEQAWDDCLQALRAAPRLAIDLEANSMFAYAERACLIQVSTANADFIIDPLADLDLSGLGALVEDPAIEKIFHAAEYDLILLRRDYGWRLHNLFDTMWAARILGYQQVGLANILEQFFGVRLSKRYQKANWCHRPLMPAELAYAQKDTHYLPALRDRLAADLALIHGMSEGQQQRYGRSLIQIIHEAAGAPPPQPPKRLPRLPEAVLARYDLLHRWRKARAQARGVESDVVMSREALWAIAKANPRTLDELQTLNALGPYRLATYGEEIIKIGSRG